MNGNLVFILLRMGMVVIAGIIFSFLLCEEVSKICFEDECFNLEIADDDLERAKGLMFREKLCSDCGMLFKYNEEGYYKFWMKNTLIPLKIIWLDRDLEVVHIENAIPCESDPCSVYGPDEELAKYVLEVNSDKLENLEIRDSAKLL